MIEEVKKLAALQKEFVRLYNSDLGFIGVESWGVQVKKEMLDRIPGTAREYRRNCDDYPCAAEKYYEDVRFYAIYKKEDDEREELEGEDDEYDYNE